MVTFLFFYLYNRKINYFLWEKGIGKVQNKKFQIFISSTYKDLIDAREQVISTILSMYHFPVGMEMFSADDDEQWKIIQDTMKDSDYYILIIGHRYGSVTKEGISYTEKEYEYAKSLGIPIMSFVRNREVATTPDEREDNQSKKKKLDKFINKVTEGKMCEFWEKPEDLINKITIALVKSFSRHQRVGWVRADKAVTPEMSEEFLRLSKENHTLRQELEELKKKQIDKEPNLGILINNSNKLEVEFQDFINFEPLKYPKQIQYNSIEQYLLPYLTEGDINNYNTSLPSIQEIDKFNQEAEYYTRLSNTGISLSFDVYNFGSAKANEIYIDMDFPEEIKIIKKDEIEDLEFPDAPKMPENPIEVAEKAYRSRSTRYSKSLSSLMGDPFRGMSAVRDKFMVNNNLPRTRYTILNENTITIKMNDLLHTRRCMFDDEYLLIPLKRGTFYIYGTVICEQYLKEKRFTIPIVVS